MTASAHSSPSTAGRLAGKVALVTGGSRGMGADIALRLAREGAAVALTYAASAEKAQAVAARIQESGGRALAIRADSAQPAQLRDAVAQAVKTFGGLDILVNNAGIALQGEAAGYSLEDFDRMVNVNVKAPFVATQAALAHMKAGGRIINIGSVMSGYSVFAGASVYTMTKAAVAGLTRGLARELGQRGITVNNVQPGPIDTDMNPADGPAGAALSAATALGRYGRGAEIADLVAFLASAESAYITGTGIVIDGGLAA